ncbi:hypothetical protein DYB35_006818 [Aphanomyces astaci]|uniref:JmjC domain-containing protein n=1 Tax=Aphanomyces astaci TaxID=112090 RepID=A0A418CIZ1_APHAT|nr:hypothetical protein DYB35_006818 [Aphanomyces astaci]
MLSTPPVRAFLEHKVESVSLYALGAYKDHRTRIQFNSTAAQKRAWSLESLVANPVVANTMVDTKRKVADSVRWARLEDGPRQSVGSFIQAMQRDDCSAEPPLYIHDVLFVGPRGSESATHVDSFGSNFWMALVQGRKRWRLVHPNDMHLLYPTWHAGSADVVYGVDLASTDESKGDSLYPLHARVWECVLEAGDILFVPAGTPHFVQNLEHTVAVSSNYIDATNWTQASSALKHQVRLHITVYVYI